MIDNIENVLILGFTLIEIAVIIFSVVFALLIVLIPIHILRIKRSLESIDKKMSKSSDLAALNIKKLNELIEVSKKF